jgi:predicted nucleotidyltransferase
MVAMTTNIHSLLAELKAGLQRLYGTRLKGVYLYGSYARGEPDAESDVDVLVVLDHVDHYCAEIDRSGYLASELSLKYGVSISKVFVNESAWLSSDTAFLANVRDDAVAA